MLRISDWNSKIFKIPINLHKSNIQTEVLCNVDYRKVRLILPLFFHYYTLISIQSIAAALGRRSWIDVDFITVRVVFATLPIVTIQWESQQFHRKSSDEWYTSRTQCVMFNLNTDKMQSNVSSVVIYSSLHAMSNFFWSQSMTKNVVLCWTSLIWCRFPEYPV